MIAWRVFLQAATRQFVSGLGCAAAAACLTLLAAPLTCASEPAAGEEAIEQAITESDREHWSFQPLRCPELPPLPPEQQASASHSVPLQGPIDLFIAQQLHELQLELAPQASRAQLLRRLAFDLTGLPPDPEMLARFEQNASHPDAYEREVDRLLASAAFGEHVAQSWLDLARFAETDGFEHDKVRPDAWRYRDWVIAAFNEAMPYDRFMTLQVAGDLIAAAESSASASSSNPSASAALESANSASANSASANSASANSASANSASANSVATMFCLAGPDMPDVNDQQERRHNLLNEMTGTVGATFLGLQLGCAVCHDHKYDPVSQADFYRLRGVLESGVPAEFRRDKPYVSLQENASPSVPRLYVRGDYRLPAAKLACGVPRIVADEQVQARVADAQHPRLALAQWLVSDTNPLPARTMANRIWQSHFGRGLAGTPSDLGLVGIEPTHPELFDWLACQLRDGGWDLKRLRRQVVCSSTYKQCSLATDEDAKYAARLERDPENRAYSRYPRRRLTGEMLRDAMLSAAGALDRRVSGPSVMPPLPDELVSTLLPGQWHVSDDLADQHRRSIYVFARRNLRYPIFESFDRPDAGASCPERGRSVTATQSLLLMNSEFSLRIAETLGRRAAEAESTAARAEVLWRSILSRPPTDAECELLSEFLDDWADDAHQAALIAAALALLNSNEFVSLD